MDMPKLHWEDFKPGAVAVYGPRLVTREEIVAFAAEFDPQPMHLDEAAASATMLGGLGASGWHICCLLMRIIADGFVLDSTSMGAPGIEEVRWLKPLRPGTQIRVRATVLESRASNSRPEMGLVEIPLRGARRSGDDCLTSMVTIADARPPRAGSGAMKYFEDIRVGDVSRSAATPSPPTTSRPLPCASIRSRSMSTRRRPSVRISARCAPPAGTPRSAWMRLMVDYRRRMAEATRARGEPVAGIGPALGFRELKWLKPVYVGDTHRL